MDENFIKEVGIQQWKLNDSFQFKNNKIKVNKHIDFSKKEEEFLYTISKSFGEQAIKELGTDQRNVHFSEDNFHTETDHFLVKLENLLQRNNDVHSSFIVENKTENIQSIKREQLFTIQTRLLI